MQYVNKPFNAADLPVLARSSSRKVSRDFEVSVSAHDLGVARGWAMPGADMVGVVYINWHPVCHRNADAIVIFSRSPFARNFHPRHLHERPAGMPSKLSLRALNYLIDELLEEALAGAATATVAA